MVVNVVRRVLIGPPLPTQAMVHERLNRVQGLAVFASDALSSSAYATEEILLALLVAGPAALQLAWPVALAIAAVLVVVAFSYFQTIHAYPAGGGAYIVAHDNLGLWPGLVAAAALLIDYVMTVAVSVSAGVAAVTSAVPLLYAHRVTLALLAVAVIAVVNLRGVRESGTVFSVPTYAFIVLMGLLVVVGLVRLGSAASPPAAMPPAGALPVTARPAAEAVPAQALTVFVVLKAFASGSAAMTGVEAISNGIPAFRPPEAHNAAVTLVWMAAILASLFLGLTYLATHLGIIPTETETVVSQIARTVFGDGSLYLMVQAATAMILILAANTSFADFPRLSAILARDRFMPNQMRNLGDRLVYANGIVLLALVAGALIAVFDARTHGLIPLYAVGVFLSFTLSQAGMVRRWWQRRGRGWRRSLAFNLLGAAATGVVLVVVTVAKWRDGAWIVAGLVPALVWMMRSIHRHYDDVRAQLTLEGVEVPRPLRRPKVVVPVGGVNRGVLPALRYARALSDDVTAVIVDVDPQQTADVVRRWPTWGMGIPLKVLPSPYRSVLQPILRYLDELEWEVGVDQHLTVVLPEFVPARWWHFLLHNHNALLLKAALYFRRRRADWITVVTDVPFYLMEEEPGVVVRLVDWRMVGLVAATLAAVGGLLASVAYGWPPAAQAAVGLAALALVVVLAAALVARSLRL
ncbi:MAG: APC family permease [Armatimonadota bacterium]|nr:APC family permease [Armatimonadota bacterium]MDR7532940.1 APC family permease [Armatimonadota bacterium]MDR7536412.1 APC family permease [Armatimonadota bacterium]